MQSKKTIFGKNTSARSINNKNANSTNTHKKTELELPAANLQKFAPGEVYELKAVRDSDLGLFLDAGTGSTSDDILLHKTQQTKPVQIGDTIQVYLYMDPRKRLAASMRLPTVQVGELAYVEIINKSKDGIFVDIGAERGVFMPFSQMYGRPQVGTKVWIKLYVDKTGRKAVTMKVEEEFKQLAQAATNVKKGDVLTGYVYNILDDGFLMLSEEKYIMFLHNDECHGQKPEYAQMITARVAFIREDGRVNVSLRPLKQNARMDDAERILEFMKARKGSMPYTDDTDADIIKDRFQISKGAFKRAIGKLLKDGLVEQKDGWTVLVTKD